MGNEDPKFLFSHISRLETTMRAVGIEKSESKIVQIILRQLPERYDIVKKMTLADPQLTRPRLETPSVPPTPNARPTKLRKEDRRRVRRRNPRTRMLLSSAVVLGTGGPGEAEANEGTTVWYSAAVACRGSRSSRNTDLAAVACCGSSSNNNIGLAAVACRGSSSDNTGLEAVACRGSSSDNTGLEAVACRGSSSNSSNGLAGVVFLISIDVAPILFLPPGRRARSNRCSNRHGESLRSELAGSTTAGATPYTSRGTHLSRQAPRCVRCTAVAVAAKMGTGPNTVVHCVGLMKFAVPAASMVKYGGTALCALSSRGQPHLNVFTSSGECYVTNAHGADTIVIPQQQQHHQPAVDLGGEDIPFQQPSDSMHYSIGMSGAGGGDGDAIGTGVQQQMAVAGQQSLLL